jgi:hypothetical protein
MGTVDGLRAALHGGPDDGWLSAALDRVAAEPAAIGELSAAAGRRCGRGPLAGQPDWTVEDAARLLLLLALPAEAVQAQVDEVYRYGDAAEKRAVLRALPFLELPATQAGQLLHDAIRTNDTGLLAAALGPAASCLDDAAWRQAVLKCVFMEVPLSCVADLPERADPELAAMLASFAEERRAAGRDMPADARALLHRLTRVGRTECASSTRTST